MPRAGEGCGSSVGHEEPCNSRELPASPHRAHSEGQAETWPLSEILSREDKGENSSDDVDAGGWAFQFTEPVCWEAEGSVTERESEGVGRARAPDTETERDQRRQIYLEKEREKERDREQRATIRKQRETLRDDREKREAEGESHSERERWGECWAHHVSACWV